MTNAARFRRLSRSLPTAALALGVLLVAACGPGEDANPPDESAAEAGATDASAAATDSGDEAATTRPAGDAAAAADEAPAEDSAPKALLDPSQLTEQAPEQFTVRLETTKGPVLIEVRREWAPNGADRFYNLVKNHYYDDIAVFRAIDDFMVQFGIHGDPAVNAAWQEATIPPDPVVESNVRGMVTYAMGRSPDTRTVQLFINTRPDNSRLDASGFAPFGKVVEGMDVVDQIYTGYGEGAPRGAGPSQQLIQDQGNAYLRAQFPRLDYIETARIVSED